MSDFYVVTKPSDQPVNYLDEPEDLYVSPLGEVY